MKSKLYLSVECLARDGSNKGLTLQGSNEWIQDRLQRIIQYWDLDDLERVREHTKILNDVIVTGVIPYDIFYE